MVRTFDDIDTYMRHISEQMAEIRGELLCARVVVAQVAYQFLKQAPDTAQEFESMRLQSRAGITDVQIAGRADEDMVRIMQSAALTRHEQTFEELSRALGLRRAREGLGGPQGDDDIGELRIPYERTGEFRVDARIHPGTDRVGGMSREVADGLDPESDRQSLRGPPERELEVAGLFRADHQ